MFLLLEVKSQNTYKSEFFPVRMSTGNMMQAQGRILISKSIKQNVLKF